MGDDSAFGWAFVIVFLLGFFLGVWAASTNTDWAWEAMLVDSPAQIELIRARVLAERAESKSK